MSALTRIVSGSSASLLGLIVNMASQIALVPIMLSHWNATTFGVWAAFQGLVTMLQLIDMGHQEYVGFECLRMPVTDRDWRRRILSAALPFSIVSGSSPLLIVAVLWITRSFDLLLRDSARSASLAAAAAAIYAFAYLPAQCFTGLLGRVLSSVGESPRVQWTNVSLTSLTAILQGGAVLFGAGLLAVVTIQAMVTIPVGIFINLHYIGRLRSHSISLQPPEWRLGARNFIHSLVLTLGSSIEALQNNGFRVMLVPIIGPAALARFTTLRTVANTAQQGINLFVWPTIPELMRVAASRSVSNTIAVLSLLMFMAVMLIAPGLVILQLIGPSIYQAWTRGQVAWDGMTFALLSVTILMNGFGQSGRALLRGNNLLRLQLIISISAGSVLLLGTWLFVSRYGLFGAALALAAGETARAMMNIVGAHRWLTRSSLQSPLYANAIAGCVVIACATAMVTMAWKPVAQLKITVVFLLFWIVAMWLFWLTLPGSVHERLRPLLRKVGRIRGVCYPVA